MASRENRPDIVGPEVPEKPYPIQSDTLVIAGFGRGSSDLGIPTANIPYAALQELGIEDTGIYYGWAQVGINEDPSLVASNENGSSRDLKFTYGKELSADELAPNSFPMVMSIGWNPFYNNTKKTGEIHIIHKFTNSFYGAKIKFNILGYIRPELNYISKEALIDDINKDIEVALRCLERPNYAKYKF